MVSFSPMSRYSLIISVEHYVSTTASDAPSELVEAAIQAQLAHERQQAGDQMFGSAGCDEQRDRGIAGRLSGIG
jgi:hypothetical protein